ncbi:ParE family toxin-like protein [Thermodesulfatator autotrophicus]|uniref:ParE-like toxin domain-containing protein n=1 Tax=Thermodesulfatator autotrophicus TaxID=1795632 RepID=A0A177E9S4_9BACT|nr:hypothetical protein [Thermodesulfatator autotrophicus]OAG27759.1 hypothetical protein TH606_05235 [Thermodesulfatator autotrophicus]
MHKATSRFWKCFEALPGQVKQRAKVQFGLLKENPHHPSLHFKKTGNFWSVRITDSYRALAIKDGNDYIWVWIGTHEDYEKMLKRI